MLKNGQHTLKILRCEHRKIFKVCLAIFQHYEINKGLNAFMDNSFNFNVTEDFTSTLLFSIVRGVFIL